MVPTSSAIQYPQQPSQLPQAAMLQGGVPSGQTVHGHINQPVPLPQQYIGSHLLHQQQSFPVGTGSAAVPLGGQPMPRTSSIGNIASAAQPMGQQQIGGTAVGLNQPHLPQQTSLAHQPYPNMAQSQLPQGLGVHSQLPNYHDLNQAALQGQAAMDMYQHAQQPGVIQAMDDAARMASVLANKPHLQSDLSRTPSPGDQQQGTQKPPQHQPVGTGIAQIPQHAPINMAIPQQVGIVGQQVASQPSGVQPQQITNLQAQQQLVDGSVPSSSVNTSLGAQSAAVTGPEGMATTPAAKPPMAPQIRQVMAMDIRPRAGSEPKTVHHGTRREELPSKANRQELPQAVPHRLHTTLDPHVKRTQSLKERTVNLAVAPQEMIGNQCTPNASPKPQRRQTVDGTISTGIQQAVQQFHGVQSTQLPQTVASHMPVFTQQMQQMSIPGGVGTSGTVQQIPMAGSVIPPNCTSVHGLVETATAIGGMSYVAQPPQAIATSVLSAQHLPGSANSVQTAGTVPPAQSQPLVQPVPQQQLPHQVMSSQPPSNQTQQ